MARVIIAGSQLADSQRGLQQEKEINFRMSVTPSNSKDV